MNQEYLKGIHSEMCSREAIIFQATENNIISFLKNSLFAERSEIRTLDGKTPKSMEVISEKLW